jgi:hypothetical protein
VAAAASVHWLLVLQVCFKQNIHGRSLADIKAMAKAWEAAPLNYTLATADSLFKEEGAHSSSSSTRSACWMKQLAPGLIVFVCMVSQAVRCQDAAVLPLLVVAMMHTVTLYTLL